MRISDWSSDLCSSDLDKPRTSTSRFCLSQDPPTQDSETYAPDDMLNEDTDYERPGHCDEFVDGPEPDPFGFVQSPRNYIAIHNRSEEHTSELQSLMRNSYAVFCLKKTTKIKQKNNTKKNT